MGAEETDRRDGTNRGGGNRYDGWEEEKLI